MKKSYFITSTGTDCGKTFLTTALCWQLRQKNIHVSAIKPVISGYNEESATDTSLIAESLGLELTHENINIISPWRYKAALAAPIAAQREGVELKFEEVAHYCHNIQANAHEVLLIEGAGGVMSPLAEHKTVIDLIEVLQCPALLIVGDYLGSMSHALTAFEALASRKIPIQAIIINESLTPAISLQEQEENLRKYIHPDIQITTIPRINIKETPHYRCAPDLTHLL